MHPLSKIATVFTLLALSGLFALGEILAAIDINSPQARADGVSGAVMLVALLMIMLVPLQFSRKGKMKIYAQIVTIGLFIGYFYQSLGFLGVDQHFISHFDAVGMIIVGLVISAVSFLFGVFGHRIISTKHLRFC